MLALIAAYAQNYVIGKNQKIPWNIPEDKHRFRDLTMGHSIIMGRRTYEEIGYPLPGRETIVISNTKNFDQPHCVTAANLAEALELVKGQKAFICGGAQLYQEALPLADILYLTEIHQDFEGDVYFPKFDKSDFEQTEQIDKVSYTFVTYRRRMMNYEQAREYINELTVQKGIVLGLTPVRDMLKRLGGPQNQYPIVHIAGTNGKGSTLAMIAAILRAQGYKVGTYATPAVFEPLECWQVNHKMISETEYAVWMTRLRAVRNAMQAEGKAVPTAFEMETVLAFCWMAQQKCEIAVVECGMGGALDATNVITTTAVSVLTSIGMDHMKFLGNTIEQIAQAKGGIIKPNVPVVLQGQNRAIEREISSICSRMNSPLTIISPEEITVTNTDASSVTFDYREQKQLTVSLSGMVQARNAAAAIAAVQQIKDFPVTQAAIRKGLQTVHWRGRMEQICSKPIIIIDGAHNPNAAECLRKEVLSRWGEKKIIEIIGVLADKDFTEVGRQTAPLAKYIITVTPDNPRALQAGKLAECFKQFCSTVTAADSVKAALELALDIAGEDDIILAFGSLSWLHELRDAVEEVL